MVEQQHYLPPGLPHPGDLSGPHGLSENRPSAPPTASTYTDITPFSTVSSFNLPAHCDSSLLTPISATSSPPLHHTRKAVRQYHPSSATYTQVPTPPGSSKMYHPQWSSQFDMNNQASQAGSPMNTQAPVAHEFYMTDDRRTPGPPEPYMGSYGVSVGPDTQPIHHAGPSYYVDVSMENQNAMMMRENTAMPMDRHAPAPPAPLLSQPHPSHYRSTHRPGMDVDTNHAIRRSPSDSPRHRPTQGNTRVKKARPPKRQPASLRNQSQALDPADDHKNCYGEEVPPKLKPTCPDEERCIFDSRWRHRQQRGQDMWDSIQSDFARQFNKNHGKEMLQMKFKRGRSKYLEWHARDEELIVAAWKRVEKDRYQTILNTFLEMGGSRNMRLSASDIEIKLVNDVKLEEPIYLENMGNMHIRRRRRSTIKKRSGGRGEPGGEVAVSDEMLNVGSHATHNEDDVVNQVYERRDVRWDENSSTNSEMMDTHMWESRAPMKMEQGAMAQPSEHMARQACDQLLKAHHDNNNAHPNSHSTAQSLYHRQKGS